eukprot:CAMPEP_0176174284 /NCGR_PEP_ID=MMETSP0120_2-20121206/89293_1 /TAXON_ID=160619 /ORGANISM="Kryptoperidinium foliaceum, Strain CCMP 1326" /LENGTH=45 /DNA_ID= /DNA_START= /DNA_END= /DNA_ORIENTATION=
MTSNDHRRQRPTVVEPDYSLERFPDRLRMMLDDADKMGFDGAVSW